MLAAGALIDHGDPRRHMGTARCAKHVIAALCASRDVGLQIARADFPRSYDKHQNDRGEGVGREILTRQDGAGSAEGTPEGERKMAGQPVQSVPRRNGDDWGRADLLDRVPHYRSTADALPLSAVVTATGRAQGLGTSGQAMAAWVAEAKDAQLVAIRGGAARQRRFPQALVPATSWRTAVVDLPVNAVSLLPEWESSRHVAALHRGAAAGLKRNLGILLGRMCGWTTTLFLSDDVPATASHLQSHLQPASGERLPDRLPERVSDPVSRLDHVLTDFALDARLQAAVYFRDDDDNGVVRQARRWAGEERETVVPGGAVAVRSGGPLPFYPSVFNEKWIFLFQLLLAGDIRYPSPAVKYVGTMRADAACPFAVPQGAPSELADLFADGLYALLPRPRHEVLLQASSPAYWAEAAWRRQEDILQLIARLRRACAGPGMSLVHEAEASLRAALAVYSSVEEVAFDLAELFGALMRDADVWSSLQTSVAGTRPLDEALRDLGLQEFTTWLSPTGDWIAS